MDTKRKVALVSVIICVFFATIAYFAYETIRVKPEFLAEEERWQISNAIYDVTNHDTNITLKYLGENYVDLLGLHTECLSPTKTKYFEDIDSSKGYISSFSKGETQTITASYYVYNVTIYWKVHYGGFESVYATFNVLSVDSFPD